MIGAVALIISLLIIGDFSGPPNALNVILLILGFKTPFYLSLTQIQRLGISPKITYLGIMKDLPVSKAQEQIIYVNFSSWLKKKKKRKMNGFPGSIVSMQPLP